MFAIAQGPAKQNATDTINVLSGRLQSATLLEDRRSAILGLRSFSRQYPASVASGALRGLIASIGKDGEDVDTVKVVLETLLMLFNPDADSPEASEEIALWLADEFTQRQENITMLLDLLETTDFYSRLYSLQLLSAILSSRPERTEECIISARLGISRLAAILDDRREAIRNEGLALLIFLTPISADLQKVVAFENAFDRLFNIIKVEGSLSHGDRVVEDCLVLLGNLLRMNTSNQSFFRETGCVSKLAQLLNDTLKAQDSQEPVADWASEQRNRNVYALLAVLRLFLAQGGAEIKTNQTAFAQYGVLYQVLQLAFSHVMDVKIKAEALMTCADIIRGNPKLQEDFAGMEVQSVQDDADPPVNGMPNRGPPARVYVIDGLLDLTLNVSTLQAFDARLGACECIKAYFYQHSGIRKHFLQRAIEGHMKGADETANILTTLLQLPADNVISDPYRLWLAAVLMLHLIYDDAEAKALAMSVADGDASQGEEVVTCIQTMSENLIAGIARGEDERISVAYLMLLCGWLFEDPDAVNDFLGEGSNVQSLVQTILHGNRDNHIVPGLCAMLLGIVYEFSTKDSPVPRRTLHPVLVSGLGKDHFVDRLTKLRKEPLLRDFEVLPQKAMPSSAGFLPDVYFDQMFVDFAKDNFSRIIKAIDRDPGMEIPVIANGIQKGISRDLVDNLRSQLEDKDKALQKAQSDLVSLDRQLGQEKADHRKVKETAVVDVAKMQSTNEALQTHHQSALRKLEGDHLAAMENLQRQLQHVQRNADGEADRIRRRTEAEITDLKSNVKALEVSIQKANKDHVQDLQTAHEEYEAKLNNLTARLERAEAKAKDFNTAAEAAQKKAQEAEFAMVAKETLRASAQNELDDLLMVFGDMEEKAAGYKKKLKALGEAVSDGEDEENDEEDDGDEDEDEDEDENEGKDAEKKKEGSDGEDEREVEGEGNEVD